MKKLTIENNYNYYMLIDSFDLDELIEVEDDDYQGSSYYLFRDGDKYGILVFGWGSCGGCDTLDSIHDENWKNPTKLLEEVIDFRDGLYDSITWRSRDEMILYILDKDFDLEWYGHSEGGRKFISELKKYSF